MFPNTIILFSFWLLSKSTHVHNSLLLVQQWNNDDTTRCQPWPGPITSTGERHFDRLHLRAVSHQIMALVTALFPGPVRMCMLGGGGMAIPMALLSLSDEIMEVEEIHVVELHQVATWSEEIWRSRAVISMMMTKYHWNYHSKISTYLKLLTFERI